jgi:hypothetical protein
LASKQIHRLLTNRDVTTTNELARVTYHDSTTMRVFSTITLVLLPVSVVSTIFSANIIDFQSGIGGFAGNWSGPAALWWAVTTVLVTVIVGWAGERWRRRAIDAATPAGQRRPAKANSPRAAANESWTTQVRRFVNDVRVHAAPYGHKLRVGYDNVVGFLKSAAAAPPRPRYVGQGADAEEAWDADRVSQRASLSIRSEPLSPVEPERRTEGSVAGSLEPPGLSGDPALSSHDPPQQGGVQPAEGGGAAGSAGSDRVRSSGFDQASVVEKGLARVTEKAVGEAEGREK